MSSPTAASSDEKPMYADKPAEDSDIDIMGNETIEERNVASELASPLEALSPDPDIEDNNTSAGNGGSPMALPDHPQDDAAPAFIERPSSAARLNELEATLRKPDAVMEPTILSNLRDYVIANGHPQHAVELLTENYVGYPQMAHLACSWLKVLDISGRNQADTAAEGTPKQTGPKIPGSAPPSQSVAQHTPTQSAGALPHGIDRGKGMEEREVPFFAMDEAYFLRELCLQKFDPGKFSGIFAAGGGGAPQWLNGLIVSREGREVIYSLASRFQDSLLLNFAMQKILMQPGGDAEAAAVGISLVGYFGVYHRLLGVRLRQAAAARDEASLQRICKELCEGAAQSQHAYVHAQQMLRELAADTSEPWAPRFLRISQELEAAVSGPAPWKMHRWFEPEAALAVGGGVLSTGEGGDVAAQENARDLATADGGESARQAASLAAWLIADILASTSGGNPASTSDVIKLYRLYCPPESAEQQIPGNSEVDTAIVEAQTPQLRPSVHLLRQPRLIEVLLEAVFAPGKQLLLEAQTAFVNILALAVAAVEPGDRWGTASAPSSKDPSKKKNSEDQFEGPPLEQPAVISARQALESAAELAHKALRDEVLSPEEVQRGEDALREPCCAIAMLSMLRSRLISHEYWAAAYHIHKEPPFLPLLLAIVRQQPQLHSEILSLISAALGVMGGAPSGPDVARALLNVATALVAAGRVEEVVSWSERWSRNADAGLVRHLFFGIIERAAPPYSPQFASSMVRLGAVGGALKQKMGSREWAQRGLLLAEFADAVGGGTGSGAVFEPPLSKDETSFLKELNICLKNSGFAPK